MITVLTNSQSLIKKVTEPMMDASSKEIKKAISIGLGFLIIFQIYILHLLRCQYTHHLIFPLFYEYAHL